MLRLCFHYAFPMQQFDSLHHIRKTLKPIELFCTSAIILKALAKRLALKH